MSSSLRARLILASLHFVKTTLEVGFSENVEIVEGSVLRSPHFVKSTFGADDSDATFVATHASSSIDCRARRRRSDGGWFVSFAAPPDPSGLLRHRRLLRDDNLDNGGRCRQISAGSLTSAVLPLPDIGNCQCQV